MGEVAGRRRAARDAVAAKTRGLEQVACLSQELVHSQQSRAKVWILRAAVTRVAADPRHFERREPRELLRDCERAGGGRLTRAMEADVELDEQRRLQSAPREDVREAFGRRDAVDRDRQVDARRGDVGETLPLVGPERRVVDEDRLCSGFLEHLGLARLRNGQTARTECELASSDLRRLVRLRVRPELDPVSVDIGLQIVEVGLEAIEIDHRHRRLDVAERTADLPFEQLERPVGPRADDGGSHRHNIATRCCLTPGSPHECRQMPAAVTVTKLPRALMPAAVTVTTLPRAAA